MEEYYSEKLRKKKTIVKKKSEIVAKYFNIWKINPSYKDINARALNIKAISLIFLFTFIAFSTYYLSKNLILSLGVAIITLICFVIAFRDNFYSLRSFASQKFKQVSKLNPFEDLTFFFVKGDMETIYFSNKKDLVTVAIRIFRIYVMPEKIDITLNQFIKSLNRLLIPYSYQIVQIPLTNNINSLNQKEGAYDSFRTAINFSVYYDVKGILNFSKLDNLKNRVIDFSDSIYSAFSGNFYHFHIELLRDVNLINALRTHMLKIEMEDAITLNNDDAPPNKPNLLKLLLKLFICIFILIYTTCSLVGLEMSLSIIVICLLIEILIIVFVWWKECLFLFTNRNLQDDKRIKIINPLKNIEFFKSREAPESIFAHVNGRLLIGIKHFNLNYANPKFYKKNPICNPSKFFRALIAKKLSFAYTALMAPVSYHTLNKEGFKFLKEEVKNWILYSENGIKTEKDGTNWLEIRSGVWKTMMLLSVFSYNNVSLVKIRDIDDLENQLIRKANALENAFSMNFPTFELIKLKNKKVISGYMCESLKNKFFRYDGTHLNYLLFQGKALVQILELVGELKKGVETQVAAEFNTPLHLKNHITIGKTINTEILQEEVLAGFMLEQVKNLLIVNGTYEDRETITMKIVSQLIKCNPVVHSIIFDFSGDWSKLINLFKDSRYENDFLHFKLGTTYSLNLIKSDVPYDKNNMNYLDYVFEAIALAYKRDERTIDTFRNMILSNPEMDLSTIDLDLRNKQEWQKDASSNTVLAMINELNLQNSTFFHTSQSNLEDKTNVQDFIDNDKTIIIDLSASNDFKEQIFLSFIIISKLIHQLRDSKQLLNKVIVLPHIDIFFDSFFLDKKLNYGKIDKFLNPLRQKSFGFIFMASQIHYLHTNVFNYFQNIITFKATDSRDISILKNQLKLDFEFGKGYYSKSRKASYQIDYLMGLKPNVVLMKRSDLHQTFPVKLDVKSIQETKPMNYDQIVGYMKRQGYDLKNAERQLLQQTKKTIFQKDLGNYSDFIEDIIVFLKALKDVHNVFLYKKKIKDELKKCISNTVIKKTQDKQKIRGIRDKLFDILLHHGYLVENHPKTAGGSETMMTSYSVGPQYDVALKDYFQTKKGSQTDVYIDVIENDSKKEYDLGNIFQDESYYGEKDNKINATIVDGIEIYARIVSKYYYDLFRIYNNINKKNFEKALEIEKNFIRRLLGGLYSELLQANYVEENKDINSFIDYLINNLEFPFTKKEVFEILEKCRSLNLGEVDLENKVKDTYETLSNFFNKIQVKAS